MYEEISSVLSMLRESLVYSSVDLVKCDVIVQVTLKNTNPVTNAVSNYVCECVKYLSYLHNSMFKVKVNLNKIVVLHSEITKFS